MAVTDKIKIDFQLFSSGDPKLLVIVDTSIWNYISNKPAIIEIIVPGEEDPIVYNYLKNKNNVFNTSNLYLSPIGVYSDMPDGIYRVTVKGSPDSFCEHKDFLKTDKTRLELYTIYTNLGLDVNKLDEEVYRKINDIKLLIESAEAYVSVGKIYEGAKLLKRAMEDIESYNNCNNCK